MWAISLLQLANSHNCTSYGSFFLTAKDGIVPSFWVSAQWKIFWYSFGSAGIFERWNLDFSISRQIKVRWTLLKRKKNKKTVGSFTKTRAALPLYKDSDRRHPSVYWVSPDAEIGWPTPQANFLAVTVCGVGPVDVRKERTSCTVSLLSALKLGVCNLLAVWRAGYKFY